MEIILKETIDTLGQEGDIVKVKPGYARNFLIPQKKAVLLTDDSLAKLEQEKQEIATRLEQQQKETAKLTSQLEGKVVVIPRRVGEENRLFGSVTGGDITTALNDAGIEIDKKLVVVKDPIKAIGEYKIAVKTGYQATAEILVQVVPETVEA